MCLLIPGAKAELQKLIKNRTAGKLKLTRMETKQKNGEKHSYIYREICLRDCF